MKMRLQVKLTAIFSLLFIVCLGIMGFLAYYYSQQALKEDAHHHVKHVSKDLSDRINNFFFERLISIKSAATSMYIRTRLKKINQHTNNYKQLIQQMCSRLVQLKEDDPHISEFFILNPEGKVIASTNKNQIGRDKSDRDYFRERTAKITDVYLSPTLGIPTIVASAPLVDEDSEAFLGIISARIETEEIGKIVKKSIGWFEGEEAYIVNKDNFFLVGVISKNLYPLSEKFHSKNIDYCLSEHGDNRTVSIYPNYREVKVVGACQYIKDRQWALIVEIEVKQAFKAIYKLRNWFIGIGIIVSLIVISLTLRLTKQITYPLLKLSAASKEIASGNLDVSVKVISVSG